MRVYLSGPMTGYEDYNRAAFAEAAQRLRLQGHDVYNPGEPHNVEGLIDGVATHRDYMRRDLPAVLDSEAVVVLPVWERSRGACLEVATALACGIPVTEYETGREVTALPASAPFVAAAECRCGCSPADFLDGRSLSELAEAPPSGCGCGRDAGGECACQQGATHTKTGEERIRDPRTGGEKGRKPARFDLLPWDSLWEVAEHFGLGASKYADHNWARGYAWSLSLGALMRHVAAFAAGEDYDTDGDRPTPHMAAAAFHALVLLRFMRTCRDLDDRWHVPQEARPWMTGAV